MRIRDVLGMNARNLLYIRPYNPRKAIRLADDKLATKEILAQAGIPVPKTYGVIRKSKDLEEFKWGKLPKSFVLKPNRGLGGEGIIVFKKRFKNGNLLRVDGSKMTAGDFKMHVNDILDGRYSMSGVPDIAFFEEKLTSHKALAPYYPTGVPDIRVVVYNSVPVMAEMRLPTKTSQGKANLHLGGVGVGIDIATGVTTTAVVRGNIIEETPDTEIKIAGFQIPKWDQILKMAVDAQRISGIGYLGADIVIDQKKGPMILELNARAGLAIQIANIAPLRYRLERVERLKVKSAEHGVQIAKNLFGGEIETEIEGISGKEVIGTVEKVKLINKKGKEVEIEAKVDTGATSSSISEKLAKELGLKELIEFFNKIELPEIENRNYARKVEQQLNRKYKGKHKDLADIVAVYSSHGTSIRPRTRLTFELSGLKIASKVSIIQREELMYPMIVGKKDLKRFFVEPGRR
ncbi:sugar-transfer associated ATP-grasp domain-containing protein [Patescibacteria group bacterium]